MKSFNVYPTYMGACKKCTQLQVQAIKVITGEPIMHGSTWQSGPDERLYWHGKETSAVLLSSHLHKQTKRESHVECLCVWEAAGWVFKRYQVKILISFSPSLSKFVQMQHSQWRLLWYSNRGMFIKASTTPPVPPPLICYLKTLKNSSFSS